MNCHDIKPFLCDFADGALPAAKAKPVNDHVAACGTCADLVKDFRAVRTAVRDLPQDRVSAQFHERLTERMALVSRQSGSGFTLARIEEWFRVNILWDSKRVLRPALALCAAGLTIAVFNVHGPATVTTPITIANVRGAAAPKTPPVETALISQCVTQHRNDAAAQPLTDSAAVNLVDRMDDSQAGAGDATAGI